MILKMTVVPADPLVKWGNPIRSNHVSDLGITIHHRHFVVLLNIINNKTHPDRSFKVRISQQWHQPPATDTRSSSQPLSRTAYLLWDTQYAEIRNTSLATKC
jgi:hypothetical protein